MSQTTSGLRAILSRPAVYDTLQAIMGVRTARLDLVKSFVRPNHGMRVLDMGCGTAGILACLPDDTEYWGYDISEEYIAAARARFRGRGHFHRGAIDDLPPDGPDAYDIVLAIGVLHHLDDELAVALVERARGVLGASGRLITVDPCLAKDQHPVARFLVLRDRGRNVRDSEGYLKIAQKTFPRVKGTLRHRTWIPYTNWIMECTA
ncbi:MAG: class I SAM-dependent methyltransferase [Gammaproteobacteria bacterium]|nr:class I SAM-dependent methyltransferase [Gammaproteobacteria bacterium]